MSPTVAALIEEKAESAPDTPILIFVTVGPDGAVSDETRIYRELARNGAALAGTLKARGIGVGDCFAPSPGHSRALVRFVSLNYRSGTVIC